MKTFSMITAALALSLGVACVHNWVKASKESLTKQATTELSCTGGSANIVFFGIKGKSNTEGDTPCFGPTADKVAVVECGGKQQAYWATGDKWEQRNVQVVAADANHAEFAEPGATNASGSVEVSARCTK